MKEIRDIITAFNAAQQQGRQTALATVVQVEGSSYRRPGARMLIEDDGRLTGAISGGCLEGDALRKAMLVMSQQKPMLVTYDTMDDDDAKLGVGLGCNGIIHILIEPVNTADAHNPLALLMAAASQRQTAVVVTLFNLQKRSGPQPGTQLLYSGGVLAGNLPQAGEWPQLEADVLEALAGNASVIKTYTTPQGSTTAFIEVLPPPVKVVVVGAGNDVMPLVEMAAIIGWEVTVIDGRTNYATRQRFARAKQVLLAKPGQVLELVEYDAQTVFLLMTHNYNYDLALLQQLLPQQVAYIGVLGPAKKLARMLDELAEKGMVATQAQLAKVHGPAGLDVGAETPEEIALSIIAEIKAVLAGRDAAPLRHKKRPIHQQ